MEYLGTNIPINKIEPQVSVCITTYNHEHYIAHALDSVLAQETNFDFEILLGEDDSSDNTRTICIKYAEKYSDKIRLFLNNRKNVIYIDGMATGRWNFLNNIKHAKGDYIALLEGDDYWVNNLKLKKQVAALEDNIAAVGCFHETQIILQDGRYGNVHGRSKRRIFSAEDTITKISPFHTSSFIFRRSFLPDPLPVWFKKVVSADMALFMILASKGPLISIPEVMSIYRKHPGGLTENSTVKNNFHNHRIKLLKYFDQYTNGQYREKIDEIIHEHRGSQPTMKKKIVGDKISRIIKMFQKN